MDMFNIVFNQVFEIMDLEKTDSIGATYLRSIQETLAVDDVCMLRLSMVALRDFFPDLKGYPINDK